MMNTFVKFVALLHSLNNAVNTIPSFDEWMTSYGKTYSSRRERDLREKIYFDNVVKIYSHNFKNESWKMEINKFADMTEKEFKTFYMSGFRRVATMESLPINNSVELPLSVDWVAAGAVTPVKNQGNCGSCWAFSTTGAVEGAVFVNTKNLPNLSEQQLVDCSTTQGNMGCNGGLMDYGFQYIVSNGGITSETSYPYTATGPNTCQASGKPVAATITSYTDVTPNSDTALMTAIAQQPVSVAVEADQSSFQFYSSGVMTAACGTNLDHGVLAVGYGTDNGQDYYKIKNSWGADWGEQGYIRLGRGASFGTSGQCGILSVPSYPVGAAGGSGGGSGGGSSTGTGGGDSSGGGSSSGTSGNGVDFFESTTSS
jgi:C1A family cysteine protease